MYICFSSEWCISEWWANIGWTEQTYIETYPTILLNPQVYQARKIQEQYMIVYAVNYKPGHPKDMVLTTKAMKEWCILVQGLEAETKAFWRKPSLILKQGWG